MGKVSPEAGSELRPLTIVPSQGRVILGTMGVVSEATYESIFCNWSHGFRTGVSHGGIFAPLLLRAVATWAGPAVEGQAKGCLIYVTIH